MVCSETVRAELDYSRMGSKGMGREVAKWVVTG